MILNEIRSAQSTIQMSIYQIKDADIVEALCERSANGVAVDLMYEGHPYQHAFNQKTDSQDALFTSLFDSRITLHQRPENLQTAFPKGHYHARVIIVDNDRFLLTTGNFDETTFDHCRDFAVSFKKEKNPEVFDLCVAVFNRDISNQSISDLPDMETVLVGPHFQREKVIQFLSKATHKIKIYQQFFNDPVIRDHLATLISEKKIAVEIVMMAYPTNYNSDPNAETQDILAKAGADVRLMGADEEPKDRLYGHARAVIIDDALALIGTTQLSPPSLDENREISIVIQGPLVDVLVQQFSEDHARAYGLTEGRERARNNKTDWNEIWNKITL